MDHDIRKAMRIIAQGGPIAVTEMLDMFPILRHTSVDRKGFSFDLEDFITRMKIEKEDEWAKWREEIPGINFPSEWKIHMSPPMTRAIVRFKVNGITSVYLDCYGRLGCSVGPYWEVYPYKGGVGRCSINKIDELLEMIEVSINE